MAKLNTVSFNKAEEKRLRASLALMGVDFTEHLALPVLRTWHRQALARKKKNMIKPYGLTKKSVKKPTKSAS